MRYPAAEKLEIIHLIEQSHLPAKRTLAQLGIPKTTYYRWYDRGLSQFNIKLLFYNDKIIFCKILGFVIGMLRLSDLDDHRPLTE